jgi:hypothetical protein
MQMDSIQITGLTLIVKALELKGMTSGKSDWAFDKQKNNPPRLIRLQQIEILLKYFTPEIFKTGDIASGLDDLLEGKFILLRDANKYKKLFTKMENIITLHHQIRKRREFSLNDLRDNYTNLLWFKQTVNNIFNWYSGVLLMGYPYLYSFSLIDEFSKKIETKHIDKFLSLVVDPLGRTITKDKLIQDFNYPAEDIYEVDMDWM